MAGSAIQHPAGPIKNPKNRSKETHLRPGAGSLGSALVAAETVPGGRWQGRGVVGDVCPPAFAGLWRPVAVGDRGVDGGARGPLGVTRADCAAGRGRPEAPRGPRGRRLICRGVRGGKWGGGSDFWPRVFVRPSAEHEAWHRDDNGALKTRRRDDGTDCLRGRMGCLAAPRDRTGGGGLAWRSVADDDPPAALTPWALG